MCSVIRNIRLVLEYDGSGFAGWQRQLGVPTVQQTVEDVLRKITNERVVVFGAGRTDSGVHARGQVCNFATSHGIEPTRWTRVLNFYLPQTIRIAGSQEVPVSFHSQRCAITKVYEYRILNREYSSALESRVLFCPRSLDWDRIKLAMPYFVGKHDFRSFQGPKADVRSTVRTVTRFILDESLGCDGLYRLEIEGNGFLKQMVRSVVGTLLEIGEKRRPIDAALKIIEGRDRRLAGVTAPPHGLCLVRVNYA